MKVYIKNFPTVHPTLPNSRLWCTEVLFVHKFTSWTFRELVMCTILRMVNLLFALGESPLFLGKFNNLLVYFQSLPLPHSVHVPPRRILAVRFIAKMKEFFLGLRLPERVDVNGLPVGEDELRHGQPRGLLPQLVSEVQTFNDG